MVSNSITVVGVTSTVDVSLANAFRFPTVGELDNVTTCTTGCTGNQTFPYSPNPATIKPEKVNSFEATYSKRYDNANYRVSFFAEDASDAQLGEDIFYLRKTWTRIKEASLRLPPSSVLHQDLNLLQRVLRDVASESTQSIRVDSSEQFEKL